MAKMSAKFIKKFAKLSNEAKMRFIETSMHEKETLISLFNSFPAGYCVCNESGDLLFFNKSAERFLQLDRNLSRKFMNFERSEVKFVNVIGNATLRERFETRLDYKRNQTSGDVPVELSDGKTHILVISTLPLVRENSVIGLIIQIEDVTETREREKTLYQMKNLANLTSVAANLAHEIKNPLGSISIYIQLLQRELAKSRATGNLPDEKHGEKYLQTINDEIERLNALVVDFLAAVRPVRASMQLVDAVDALKEFADFFEPEAKSRNVVLIRGIPEESEFLKIDKSLFKQVIANLVKNALDSMPSGGKMLLKAEKKDGKFFVFVGDTGAGIATDAIPHIFEPYWTTKTDGTGLGLATVYKIVKEFDGKIEVQSRLGEGTIFTIALPIPQTETRLLPAGGN